MRVVIGLVLCAAMCAGCQSTHRSDSAVRNGNWTTYGEAPMGAGDAVAIGALQGDERNVVVHGVITDVCKIKGCWMTIRDDAGQELFVKFKDYGFFVPRNATGHDVVVHGWTRRVVVDVDELRHYAEDARKSAAEVAAITEPEERTTFYANSVMIAGAGLQEPYQEQPGAAASPLHCVDG